MFGNLDIRKDNLRGWKKSPSRRLFVVLIQFFESVYVTINDHSNEGSYNYPAFHPREFYHCIAQSLNRSREATVATQSEDKMIVFSTMPNDQFGRQTKFVLLVKSGLHRETPIAVGVGNRGEADYVFDNYKAAIEGTGRTDRFFEHIKVGGQQSLGPFRLIIGRLLFYHAVLNMQQTGRWCCDKVVLRNVSNHIVVDNWELFRFYKDEKTCMTAVKNFWNKGRFNVIYEAILSERGYRPLGEFKQIFANIDMTLVAEVMEEAKTAQEENREISEDDIWSYDIFGYTGHRHLDTVSSLDDLLNENFKRSTHLACSTGVITEDYIRELKAYRLSYMKLIVDNWQYKEENNGQDRPDGNRLIRELHKKYGYDI
jgi:hypothetical protein